MKVPFIDLKAQYDSIRDEIDAVIQSVLQSSMFAGGPFVERFEEEFAQFCGCRHAVGVGSGTEALWLALLGLGIGSGDEVITVPHTFIATAEAISFCNAKPVFVDIDEATCTMDPRLIEKAITPRTKAVIPVHLYGQTADMDPIMEVARAHGLFVIEDACQAHGAQYKGKPAGSMGDAGCFSFYPGKNLGAYGEAGAIVTNNGELAAKLRVMRDHGQPTKYYHSMIGWNARMDGIQGAVLSAKMKHLSAWNDARRKNASLYNQLLAEIPGLILPQAASYAEHVYHLYAVRIQKRDELLHSLATVGIQCGIHYPVPVHLQEAYRFLGLSAGSFPLAEQCANEVLSLPMFPELSESQITYVCGEIGKRLRSTQ